ncbi:MAG TPA: hypothetical protein VLD65_10105 [Anaerolineales bacterium]|nr:hypothetical protein [Anaerolineales bacterium]
MAYIKTIDNDQAEGLLKELYLVDEKALGYVPGYAKIFSLNPEAYEAWKKLIASIRSKMRLRRYELVTFSTAMSTHCTY